MTISQSLMSIPGQMLWNMPRRFTLAKFLGRKYSVRCVLFHHISDHASPFTERLGVRMARHDFEARIRFLSQHYTPIDLATFLTSADKGDFPPRPVIVTFDDAYASVAEEAAPICQKYHVPALVFVNASFVGNQQLSIDNLVCYVTNVFGLSAVRKLAQQMKAKSQPDLRSMSDVFSEFLPSLTMDCRQAFMDQLVRVAGVQMQELAKDTALYLTAEQVRQLASSGFEIGNHTYSHVHGRCLSGRDFYGEIDQNKSMLETMSGRSIRAFSVPYGSVADLTPDLESHLRKSGYEAAFLVESRTNTQATDFYHMNRVSLHSTSDRASFAEIEVLPRLREIRDCFTGTSKTKSELGRKPLVG
jgi:peptidoglycan/xylan/chitin deacetylase (PgdA/CDA1 family)